MALLARLGGRLGVYAIDTGSRAQLDLNGEERFAMCSTFKLLLAAAVLARVDAGALRLDHRVAFGAKDMVPYAPVTSARLAEGAMSVRDLCAAAMVLSDNPAANLLLPLVGGPSGLTRFLRDLGDPVTRLDRTEPELNTNLPGDLRDTTTPVAMARSMERLLAGPALTEPSRSQLIAWAVDSKTGRRRLRAGLPPGWEVGDKTGSGMNGAVNNVAIAWPPGRAPILVASFMSGSTLPGSRLDAAHAEVGRLVAQALVSA